MISIGIGGKGRPVLDVEKPYPLRSVKLVRRGREHINPHGPHVYLYMPHCLNRVRVEDRPL